MAYRTEKQIKLANKIELTVYIGVEFNREGKRVWTGICMKQIKLVYVIAWVRAKLVFNFTRVFKVSHKVARVA